MYMDYNPAFTYIAGDQVVIFANGIALYYKK